MPLGTESDTTFHSFKVESLSGTPAWSSILSAPDSTHSGRRVKSSLELWVYLIAFAAGGQAASQLPHPMHNSLIIFNSFGIASVGQVGMHKLQDTQLSL